MIRIMIVTKSGLQNRKIRPLFYGRLSVRRNIVGSWSIVQNTKGWLVKLNELFKLNKFAKLSFSRVWLFFIDPLNEIKYATIRVSKTLMA